MTKTRYRPELTRGPRGGVLHVGEPDSTTTPVPDIAFASGRVRLSADLDDRIRELETELEKRAAERLLLRT